MNTYKNDKEHDSIVLYLDNEGKKENNFDRYNYVVLKICLIKDNKLVKLVDLNKKTFISLKNYPDLEQSKIIKVEF